MAKKSKRTPRGAKSVQGAGASLRFSRVNLILGGAGVTSVALGYLLLSQGSITLAPLFLVLGYVVLIPMAIIL